MGRGTDFTFGQLIVQRMRDELIMRGVIYRNMIWIFNNRYIFDPGLGNPKEIAIKGDIAILIYNSAVALIWRMDIGWQ